MKNKMQRKLRNNRTDTVLVKHKRPNFQSQNPLSSRWGPLQASGSAVNKLRLQGMRLLHAGEGSCERPGRWISLLTESQGVPKPDPENVHLLPVMARLFLNGPKEAAPRVCPLVYFWPMQIEGFGGGAAFRGLIVLLLSFPECLLGAKNHRDSGSC